MFSNGVRKKKYEEELRNQRQQSLALRLQIPKLKGRQVAASNWSLLITAELADELRMDYDENKIDDAVLALLHLTLHDQSRAWKGHDWDALNRLYEKGFIDNPKNKAKSVALTEEGLARSAELCERLFSKKG